jgi:hypothetical protein
MGAIICQRVVIPLACANPQSGVRGVNIHNSHLDPTEINIVFLVAGTLLRVAGVASRKDSFLLI